jgi:hypothetical protein
MTEEHKNNLIKKLINENSSGSNWWKTVKQLTGIKSRDHEIPPLVKNDNKDMLNNLHRGFLSIEDASFNNLGFIKSGLTL